MTEAEEHRELIEFTLYEVGRVRPPAKLHTCAELETLLGPGVLEARWLEDHPGMSPIDFDQLVRDDSPMGRERLHRDIWLAYQSAILEGKAERVGPGVLRAISPAP